MGLPKGGCPGNRRVGNGVTQDQLGKAWRRERSEGRALTLRISSVVSVARSESQRQNQGTSGDMKKQISCH